MDQRRHIHVLVTFKKEIRESDLTDFKEVMNWSHYFLVINLHCVLGHKVFDSWFPLVHCHPIAVG